VSALLDLLHVAGLATAVPLDRVVLLAAVLFSIGLAGVTSRRNVLIVLLSVEIMLNAANLALVAFSKVHGDPTGQVFVFFAMTVAAAEVAVGLAIVIAVYRLRRTTDVGEIATLHDVDYGPVPYPQLEGKPAHGHHDTDSHHDGSHHGGSHDDGGHGDDGDAGSESATEPASKNEEAHG
jgi:NADH-quinone oxidoreductase subunit K